MSYCRSRKLSWIGAESRGTPYIKRAETWHSYERSKMETPVQGPNMTALRRSIVGLSTRFGDSLKGLCPCLGDSLATQGFTFLGLTPSTSLSAASLPATAVGVIAAEIE